MTRDRDPTPTEDAAADASPLDFELVSFDAAREALEEPPPGVPRRRLGTQDWILRRRPLSESARRLTRGATQWLLGLPQDVRPVELLRRYPRIANKLAECWSDPDATERQLDDLVLDRRGGRQGFPPLVANELLRLRERWERDLRLQQAR
jgi:hypothetical protein